ncbi:MAG: CZB domain-containing protein, partial [Bacteriovoracia bacterium]
MKMTIGKRIGLGFTVILVLLAILVAATIYGINTIVDNAEEVIEGNKLKAMIVEREVDHLNWAQDLNLLLTDDKVHEFHGGVDPTKCAFGKWYYSDDRQKVVKSIPALAPILEGIEEHHNNLHLSAKSIVDSYKPADDKLPGFLAEKEADHFRWAVSVSNAILAKNKRLKVETDPTKCSFGKLLYSEKMEKIVEEHPEVKALVASVKVPHKELHQSAIQLGRYLRNGDFDTAKSYYRSKTLPALNDTRTNLKSLQKWADGQVEGLQLSKNVYSSQTVPALKNVRESLHKLVAITTENVMTDEQMLSAAQATQNFDLIMGILVIIIGILLAMFIIRSIVKLLLRISEDITRSSAEVTAASDEVSSASQILAESSNEQASSIEETSASLEELAGMVKNNVNNAQKSQELTNDVN